jgi:hypothetical protein
MRRHQLVRRPVVQCAFKRTDVVHQREQGTAGKAAQPHLGDRLDADLIGGPSA